MKITPPRSSNPGSAADWSDVEILQRALHEATEALGQLAAQLGQARQVREFSSDQRKRVLAIAALPFLKAGLSATAADLEARGSEPYQAALAQLAKDLTVAEQVIAEHDFWRVKWEAARSLLSCQREAMKL